VKGHTSQALSVSLASRHQPKPRRTHTQMFKGDADMLVDRLIEASAYRPSPAEYTGHGRELQAWVPETDESSSPLFDMPLEQASFR
jgi:hypothetical protein